MGALRNFGVLFLFSSVGFLIGGTATSRWLETEDATMGLWRYCVKPPVDQPRGPALHGCHRIEYVRNLLQHAFIRLVSFASIITEC